MRKLLYSIAFVAVLAASTSCNGWLETSPSDSVDSGKIFDSAQNAMTAMNGIYRAMYSGGWGAYWNDENGGIMAYITASDLMGEDHIQYAQSSGWFYYDYTYGISSDWTISYGRQGQCWNFFYTIINNANNIIAQEENIQDDPSYANYVLGQAYAIRAYAYLWLIQNFQQCDPELPGVPIYKEPTTIESKGAGRGKVKDVYSLINEDLEIAITMLEGLPQEHPSHIDYYVANGIKARALMVQKKYPEAIVAAKEALKKPGAGIAPMSELAHVNDVSKKNVLWGLAIQSDQSLGLWGIYSHIDADCGTGYSDEMHLISAWLYDNMSLTDGRRDWWTAPLPKDEWEEGSSKMSYCQVKLVFKDATLGTGDYILMRMEEMALIVAEAACHREDYDTAREYLSKLLVERDPDYATELATVPDSKEINGETSLVKDDSLMDYILFNRRVELWGEVSRMHDLQRLGLKMNREYSYAENNHTYPVSYPAAFKRFIYAIPLEEFNGNTALDPVNDQNPM